MAKKEFRFQGKSLEELQQMSKDELLPLFTSRVRRTLKRGYSDEGKKAEAKVLAKDRVKTHFRELIILPQMVGKTILCHNGNKWIEVRVQEEMIGHVLGEYALTRSSVKHGSAGVGATRSSSAQSVR